MSIEDNKYDPYLAHMDNMPEDVIISVIETSKEQGETSVLNTDVKKP